eukprot:scaffold88390_cov15-Tisochrysis_lutea.AAC.1
MPVVCMALYCLCPALNGHIAQAASCHEQAVITYPYINSQCSRLSISRGLYGPFILELVSWTQSDQTQLVGSITKTFRCSETPQRGMAGREGGGARRQVPSHTEASGHYTEVAFMLI